MALPILEKTWQHNVNNQLTGTGVPADMRRIMRSLKNAMKGYDNSNNPIADWTNGFTVLSSCEGSVFGNGDGIDRWLTDNDLVGISSEHSWIVLQQSAINAKYEVCFDLRTEDSFQRSLNVIWSSSAGFGTANGGSDGTLTSRPTANDEIVVLSHELWVGDISGATDMVLHWMSSIDGECNRGLIYIDSIPLPLFIMDKVKNPGSVWEDAAIFGFLNATDTEVSRHRYEDLNDAANVYGSFNGIPCTFYLTTEGFKSAMVGQQHAFQSNFGGGYPLTPIGLFSESFGAYGRAGEVYDLWFGEMREAVNDGDQYPSDSSKLFTHIGDLVHPWNGSSITRA
jgi:hypothetical protein